MCTKERRHGTLTIRKPYIRHRAIEKAISDSCFDTRMDYLLPNEQLTKLEGIIWERAVRFKELHKGFFPLTVEVVYIPTGHGFGRLESWKFVK